MTLSGELVSEQIDAFPITAHVSHYLPVDGIYYDDQSEKSERKYDKEELKRCRVLDAHDQDLICVAVEKYPHPLKEVRPCLYNPISSQIAPTEVIVTNSIEIGQTMGGNTLPVYVMGL